MQFTMTAIYGPITEAMPYARRCERKAIYGAAKEAMRTFKKYKAHGRLRIKSAGGQFCATVSYAGTGDVKVVYYELGAEGYYATREDVCEIGRQSILSTKICPRPIRLRRRRVARTSFVGVRA